MARVAGALRRSGSELRSLRRPQTDVASEAEFVQPLGPEAADAGGEDGALPGGGRQFEALQTLDGAPQAGLAVEGVAGGGVLPADEEAHEVADGDRLDFAAQTVEGEAVNAGEKAAVADVLDVGGAEVSGKDEAADLQLHQAAGDVLGAQAAAVCQFLGSGRPADLGVTAEQQAAGFFAVGHLDGCTGRECEVGNWVGPEEGAHDVHVFSGEPEDSAVHLAFGGAAVVSQFVEPVVPVGDRGGVDGDEAEKGVVDFLGVAGLRPGFFDHALDGGRVQAAEIAGALGEGASGSDGS